MVMAAHLLPADALDTVSGAARTAIGLATRRVERLASPVARRDSIREAIAFGPGRSSWSSASVGVESGNRAFTSIATERVGIPALHSDVMRGQRMGTEPVAGSPDGVR